MLHLCYTPIMRVVLALILFIVFPVPALILLMLGIIALMAWVIVLSAAALLQMLTGGPHGHERSYFLEGGPQPSGLMEWRLGGKSYWVKFPFDQSDPELKRWTDDYIDMGMPKL